MMNTTMPLYEMSPNVQEPDSTRKRSHDEYAADIIKTEIPDGEKTPSKASIRPSGDSLFPPVSQNLINSSPQGSPALTEAGSSTPAQNSPSPRTPTKPAPTSNAESSTTKDGSSSANPPAKKKKLTPAEREARDKEMAEKKLEKERGLAEKKKEREEKLQQQQAKKAKQEEEQAEKKKEREEKLQQAQAKKAKQEEEKAARQKEREEKRKKKEEEEQAKAEQREEKKRLKEEEQQRIQEEKDKKARSQKTLNNFFMLPKTPKKTDDAASNSASPSKAGSEKPEADEQESEYNKLFKPYFIRDNTTLAPIIPNMDDDARILKSQIVDECIAGSRGDETSFDPVQLFSLPSRPCRRGRLHPSVKQIMEVAYREMEAAGNAGSNTAMDAAQKKLKSIPFKVIAFSQDVRPPYFGTITSRQQMLGRAAVYKQSRCSSKPLLSLEYDYDSEAEWQEEEGEDIDIDDDEEELDDEDDMDEFLDDSEDAGLSRRIFGTTMEPDSTGICFENENKKTHSSVTVEHKMEIILDAPNVAEGIDPFSTLYWEPEPKATKPTQTTNATAQMPPPPAPANAFAALSGGAASDGEPLKIVKKELLNDVKQAILDNKALSKVGIIDYIFQQFRDSASKAEVKNTLELVAEKKKGTGRAKEWDLKPGHEISL